MMAVGGAGVRRVESGRGVGAIGLLVAGSIGRITADSGTRGGCGAINPGSFPRDLGGRGILAGEGSGVKRGPVMALPGRPSIGRSLPGIRARGSGTRSKFVVGACPEITCEGKLARFPPMRSPLMNVLLLTIVDPGR